jgi:regulator of protease activity HflC (stomatin/prohibitin superfamily)
VDSLLSLLPCGLALLLAVFVLAAALRIVPEHQRMVVFRLGRYVGVYGPGLLFLLPVVDRAVPVDLRERVRRIEGETLLTQDRKRVTVDLVWSYQIVDPAKSILEVADLEAAIQVMTGTLLKSVVGNTSSQDLLTNRDLVSAELLILLSQSVEPWGAEIRNVEVRVRPV